MEIIKKFIRSSYGILLIIGFVTYGIVTYVRYINNSIFGILTAIILFIVIWLLNRFFKKPFTT
jgi:hypothetical protein